MAASRAEAPPCSYGFTGRAGVPAAAFSTTCTRPRGPPGTGRARLSASRVRAAGGGHERASWLSAAALSAAIGAVVVRRSTQRRRVAASAANGHAADSVERPGPLSRRHAAAAVAALVAAGDDCHAEETAGAAVAAAVDDPEIFVGRYSDPNHPGGYREITLLDTYKGEFREIKVEGGGGRGEPAFFTLPGTVGMVPFGKEKKLLITINFLPKGGPPNFPGVWDKDGITFLLDRNHWPKKAARKASGG